MSTWLSKERQEKAIWHEAHARARRLRSRRDELRDALSHLGLAFLIGEYTLLSDIRQGVGPHWFDTHYDQLLNRSTR